MTSLGVWKTPEPFSSGKKKSTIENGNLLERIPPAKEGLAVTESGRSLKVQSDGPHLVSLGSGRLSTAITIHPIPEGRIFVGNEDVASAKDIVIQGINIEKDHCFIENINGLVTIYPQSGAVSIDSIHITEPTRLSQGCMLCLGRSNFFRFNHPKEAHLIKQILPSRSPFAPTAFIPIQSTSSLQKSSDVQTSSSSPYMESVDFVEKVSKFEYLAHSQVPPVTSQDVPKWFVKEGIRIPHVQPVSRGLKGHSALPETNIKTPSPIVRFMGPSTRTVKPGFSTPPPYPYHTSHNRVNMSPKNTRLYSKTPDPVIMGRRSPGNLWSGRCTPTSPKLSGCRSHHVSLENLKACEHELQEQHRKAVQERLKDEEQERQERLRLEEILNLCAEYEHKAQQEKQLKDNRKDNKAPASSSSSGEFSAASSESSAPGSSNSSENSTDCNSSKCDSNVESCLSDDARCNKINKYTTMTAVQHIQTPNQLTPACCAKSGSSPTYVYSSGYHTVPNRIKTNGSLPRDRTNSQLSPTNDQTRFGSFPSDSNPPDGSTLFVNHKALNSASSEDELCAILGNSAMLKNSPSEEQGPSSPCMGTAFLAYPHSPRTRIRTVAGSRDRVAEVYENRLALNEFSQTQETQLSGMDASSFPTVSTRMISRIPESSNFMNANGGGVNKIGLDLEEEIYKLQKAKQDSIQAIAAIKQKVSDLDSQKNEALNELELEHALLSGELSQEEQQQELALNRIRELQNREFALEQKYDMTRQEVEFAKDKVQKQETIVRDIQDSIKNLEKEICHDAGFEQKLEELRSQTEVLDVERKAFEDLEFQLLEYQAHKEEEKEAVEMEIGCLKERMDERQSKIKELTLQKQSLASQIEKEKINFECQLKSCSEELQQDITNLEAVENRLKQLTSVHPHGTPESSIESSPRTSDSDLEVHGKLPRNGEWDRPQMLDLEGNISPTRRQGSNDRSDNCNSFHSFESESSSLTSSDAGDCGRRPDDHPKSVDGLHAVDGNKVRQREQGFQSSLQDERPLVNNHTDNGNFDVKRREKQKAQRPLTRYLPVRNVEFDLRQHIETAGHQIELCPLIHLTSSSCHGYLHKLGGKWRTWKKRWFVFDRLQRALLYYSDKGQTKLKGGVYFQSIEEVYVDHLHSVKSPNPHSTFCVKTYDRVYYLMAPTPESMRIWVDVIFTGAEGYMDFLAEAE